MQNPLNARAGFAVNPLLSREIRARFRDGRAFWLLFLVAAALSLLFASLYGQVTAANAINATTGRGAVSGQGIFTQLAWMGALGWLLVSPALTSGSIAHERERGWFDSLLLCPLSPGAIVLGKWLSALLFAAILVLVTLPPLALLFFFLGGVTLRQWTLIAVLHAACAMCGAAVGLASSSWSPRASTALRTAYGVILVGFFASLYGAATAGELPFRFGGFGTPNLFLTWLGRTNPVLRAVEISNDLAFQRTGICLAFLAALTAFFLSIAVYYADRPLEESPLIQRKSKSKSKRKAATGPGNGAALPEGTSAVETPVLVSPARPTPARATHGEIPIASRLRFANPVLDREVRSKFRLRQPPLAVVVTEVILAILVAGFYARTFYWALFEPGYRDLIWWGLCFTGLIVTMMAAGVMGSNGLSREREGGTWEGVRLSLLTPGEIMRGKVGASLLACALFSLPVWPLLLPCVVWSADPATRGVVTRGDVAAVLLVWAGTTWSTTLVGLWLGRSATRTGRASGQTLGFLLAFLLLSPFLLARITPEFADTLLHLAHPFVALADSKSRGWEMTLGFALFNTVLGAAIWWAMQRKLAREMRRVGAGER